MDPGMDPTLPIRIHTPCSLARTNAQYIARLWRLKNLSRADIAEIQFLVNEKAVISVRGVQEVVTHFM